MSGCEKYIQQMNRYLDGELPASQISELLEHLECCPSCRNRFDALKIIAFEMRQMQKQPPKALHENIMGAVRRTPQRRGSSYLRTAGMLAACAAMMVLTLQGDFFHMVGNYLFPKDEVYYTAEPLTPSSTEKSVEEEPATLGGEEPGQKVPEDGKKAEGRLLVPEEDSQRREEQPSEEREKVLEPKPVEEEKGKQTPPPQPQPPKGESLPKENTPAVEAFDGSKTGPQPYHIPPLDTDEMFAFYCVATGSGELPTAFRSDEIVRYPEKNCVYIYVKTREFTKTGCENLLRMGGFSIEQVPNLPKTDESMPYGLIVIYDYTRE